MDFNALIAELRASCENLPKESADRSQLSSVYCDKACKALERLAEGNVDYDSVITGLWLIAAHFAEQLAYLKPVPTLSELCFKLFRQCAKAVLNIQWQNLEDESSLRQNFLVSLANLHAKLVPFDFPRFRLLEALTENPWTNPTLAKVMGGEIEENDREEVRCYIEQEDPIILQLRVDMMLKENCEEYALNLCNSCLSHPELQSDLSVRKTQLSLLYKLGQEDKLQEECQKLSIQDAVRIIKQLQQSKTHRQICTVLAQTFMVQNWIRPSDLEANKELLRLWIRHQVLVDREQDQFKESVWAMAKLSQSTEQIILFIDVLREECGEAFLQLYVDMCIFAINVDKGQMETSMKDGNLETAAARRSDMASICAKLSCLCHHASVKVARLCALTYFALQPCEQSFAKIGTFYGQGSNCCNKCGNNRNQDHGTINPATLYEVERLLNMLRPEYLNPDHSYANVQLTCRRFLQESLQTAQQLQRKQQLVQSATTQVEGPGKKKGLLAAGSCPRNVFDAFTQQEVHNTQLLLNKMRLQSAPAAKTPPLQKTGHIFSTGTGRPTILQHGQSQVLGTQSAGQPGKAQFVFDTEKAKNKQPYGVPLEQQHHYYLMKHEKELEQRRKNAQKKREEKFQNSAANAQLHQQQQHQQQQSHYSQQPQQLPQQQYQQQAQQLPVQSQQKQELHNKQVTQIIQNALRQDSTALQKLTQGASPEVVQAVLSIMKGTVLKSASQPQQQLKSNMPSSSPQGAQPLPTVSTLLKPSQPLSLQQQQQQPPQPYREQPPPRRHPRPQLYAQPIIVSTSNNLTPQTQRLQQSADSSLGNRSQPSHSRSGLSSSAVTQKQKEESFLLAKSHVEDIRKFMQMQMSNLPQKQISEPRHMSGSTLTMNSMSSVTKLPVSMSTTVLTSRPKTTVELAQQAALANLQRQQAKQNVSAQPQRGQGQAVTQSVAKPKPHLFTFSKATGVQQQQQPPPSATHLQQQRLIHLHPQQQSSPLSFQTQNSNTMSQTSQSVLPSSDELSGSIMGIDDKIIKELLQDQGLLANTFPDIEVDSVAEDKSKKMPDLPTSSQLGILSSHQPTITLKQDHSFSSSSASHSQSYIKAGPSLCVPAQGSSSSRLTSPHNVSASNLPSSVVQPAASRPTQYPAASLASNRPCETAHSRTFSDSDTTSSNFQMSELARVSGQSSQQKPSVSVLPRDNISVLPKLEIKAEPKPTVDQLKEMMKKEDIQGEVCMDASNNATYRCIICSLAFETLDNLREHVRTVCKPGLQSSSVYNTKIKQDKANSAKAGLETTTVFQCLRCFELCVSEAGIKQHRQTCKRVPTVPSDLKKDPPAHKSKPASKSSSSGKQPSKKEHKDNSYNVPEIPLPFPYPSLNAGAVLKSLSDSGSSVPKCDPSSQPSALPSETNPKSHPPPMAPQPSPRARPEISTTLSLSAQQPTSICVSPPHTVSLTPNTSCHPLSGPKDNPQSQTIPEIKTSLEPQKGIGVVKNFVHQNLDKKETPSQTTAPEPVKKLPPPSFLEISGSGGSKFYKCKACSQTLCSLESFHCHWKECVVKTENVLVKRGSREKLLTAPPLTGELLDNLVSVVQAVAWGEGMIPDLASLSDDDWKLCSLKDPCHRSTLGNITYDSASPAPEHRKAHSETENSTDVDSADTVSRKEANSSKMVKNKAAHAAGKSRTSENKFRDDTEEEEEGEETDNSISESERNSLHLSTREAPPRLRDRKTLKPIQSFINETFVSPYSKSVRHGHWKDDGREGEGMEDKESKPTSGSEADSDADSFSCRVCKTAFQNKRILLQHYVGKHLQPYTVKTVADTSSYFCHLCQKTFSTFMHYMQHVPNHSVTIYEKMRVFIASKKLSQRSERIASQRGLTQKTNISPKMAKALKSKKMAMDRLKQQFLASKTQSVREKLRLSKRKRSLPHRFTSSEEDYSSDASNNVVFRSRKSSSSGTRSDDQRPLARRGRGGVKNQKSQSQSTGDESSVLSSGDERDVGPRLTHFHDDDYVASEDMDSDSSRRKLPPTTRSRRRSGQTSDSAVSKRRRTSLPCYISEQTENESDAYSEDYPPKGVMLDSDADSNSTTLFLSKNNEGNYLPVKEKLEVENEGAEQDQSETSGTNPSVVPVERVRVRSLSRREKEQLTICDLHPSVVLQVLSAEELQASQNDSVENQQMTSDQDSLKSTETVRSHSSDKSSFLDSYLSYLNQYSQLSDKDSQLAGRSSKDSVLAQGRPPHRRNSFDAESLSNPLSRASSIFSRSNSTDVESSLMASDSETEHLGKSEVCDNQNSFQNIQSKYRTRRCSVNLGQKIDPATVRLHQEVTVETKEIVKSECGDRKKLLSPKPFDKSCVELWQSPVVCLERSQLADLYAVKNAAVSLETCAVQSPAAGAGKESESGVRTLASDVSQHSKQKESQSSVSDTKDVSQSLNDSCGRDEDTSKTDDNGLNPTEYAEIGVNEMCKTDPASAKHGLTGTAGLLSSDVCVSDCLPPAHIQTNSPAAATTARSLLGLTDQVVSLTAESEENVPSCAESGLPAVVPQGLEGKQETEGQALSPDRQDSIRGLPVDMGAVLTSSDEPDQSREEESIVEESAGDCTSVITGNNSELSVVPGEATSAGPGDTAQFLTFEDTQTSSPSQTCERETPAERTEEETEKAAVCFDDAVTSLQILPSVVAPLLGESSASEERGKVLSEIAHQMRESGDDHTETDRESHRAETDMEEGEGDAGVDTAQPETSEDKVDGTAGENAEQMSTLVVTDTGPCQAGEDRPESEDQPAGTGLNSQPQELILETEAKDIQASLEKIRASVEAEADKETETKTADNMISQSDEKTRGPADSDMSPSTAVESKESVETSNTSGTRQRNIPLTMGKNRIKMSPESRSKERSKKSRRMGKTFSNPCQNPNISLAAFIAERLQKEGNKDSGGSSSRRPSASSVSKPCIRQQGNRATGSGAGLGDELSSPTTTYKSHGSDTGVPHDEFKNTDSNRPPAVSFHDSPGALGLVDYSSSDDEDETNKLCRSESEVEPAGSLTENKLSDVPRQPLPTASDRSVGIILLTSAHYSHSVFIPAEANSGSEEKSFQESFPQRTTTGGTEGLVQESAGANLASSSIEEFQPEVSAQLVNPQFDVLETEPAADDQTAETHGLFSQQVLVTVKSQPGHGSTETESVPPQPGSPTAQAQPGSPTAHAQLGSPTAHAQLGSPTAHAQPGILMAQPGSPTAQAQPGSLTAHVQPASSTAQPGSPTAQAQPDNLAAYAQPCSPSAQLGSPSAQLGSPSAQLGSPTAQPYLGSPTAQPHPGSPTSQPGSPPAHAQPGSPSAYAQPGSPTAQAQPGSSIAYAQPGTPTAYAQPGSPTEQIQPGSPTAQVQPVLSHLDHEPMPTQSLPVLQEQALERIQTPPPVVEGQMVDTTCLLDHVSETITSTNSSRTAGVTEPELDPQQTVPDGEVSPRVGSEQPDGQWDGDGDGGGSQQLAQLWSISELDPESAQERNILYDNRPVLVGAMEDQQAKPTLEFGQADSGSQSPDGMSRPVQTEQDRMIDDDGTVDDNSCQLVVERMSLADSVTELNSSDDTYEEEVNLLSPVHQASAEEESVPTAVELLDQEIESPASVHLSGVCDGQEVSGGTEQVQEKADPPETLASQAVVTPCPNPWSGPSSSGTSDICIISAPTVVSGSDQQGTAGQTPVNVEETLTDSVLADKLLHDDDNTTEIDVPISQLNHVCTSISVPATSQASQSVKANTPAVIGASESQRVSTEMRNSTAQTAVRKEPGSPVGDSDVAGVLGGEETLTIHRDVMVDNEISSDMHKSEVIFHKDTLPDNLLMSHGCEVEEGQRQQSVTSAEEVQSTGDPEMTSAGQDKLETQPSVSHTVRSDHENDNVVENDQSEEVEGRKEKSDTQHCHLLSTDGDSEELVLPGCQPAEPKTDVATAEDTACTQSSDPHQSGQDTTCVQNSDNSQSSAGVGDKERDGEREKEKQQEGENELEDGDDLSDFDLVIEQDTSPRNIVMFPLSSLCKRSSTKDKYTTCKRLSPLPHNSSTLAGIKAETAANTSGLKALKVASAKQSKNVRSVSQNSETAVGTADADSVARKPLGGAKSLRKSSQEQFVWEVDEDNDCDRMTSITVPVPLSPSIITTHAKDKKSNAASEILKRKQKALREKMEVSPFTWDLEDTVDKEHAVHRGKDFLSVVGDEPSEPNTSSSQNPLTQRSGQDSVAHKVLTRDVRGKRPLTPDVMQRNRPTKVRRTSSLDRQSKLSTPAVRDVKKETSPQLPTEAAVPLELSFEDKVEMSVNSNSILVDDEISFKKDSFSPPVNSLDFVTSCEQNSLTESSAGEELKRKRGRPRKHPLLTSTKSKLAVSQDEKLAESPQTAESASPKIQFGLRSRHSSLDSNKSDQSSSSKRHTDNSPVLNAKRARKSEDPLTPKLRKAGLIKISKDSNSSSLSSSSDKTAPMTRSSEAAIKAFNQKSLRNRGVNPVLSTNSLSSSVVSRASPVNSHTKSSPGEGSSKLKNQSLLVRSSPQSPASKHLPIVEAKLDETLKVISRKASDINTTTAVVKRRGPSAPQPPHSVNRNRPSLAVRAGKAVGRPRMGGATTASTTVFRVEPAPAAAAERPNSKTVTASLSKEASRTVHTCLPPGTALKPKKKTSKQPNWKLHKATKQMRGRKPGKSPVAVK